VEHVKELMAIKVVPGEILQRKATNYHRKRNAHTDRKKYILKMALLLR